MHLWQHRLRVVGLHSPRAGVQPWSTREVLFLFLAELFWILLICLLNVRALHNIYVELKRAGEGPYWKKSVVKPLTPKLLYNSKFVGIYDLKFKGDVHSEYPHFHPDVPIVQLSDSLWFVASEKQTRKKDGLKCYVLHVKIHTQRCKILKHMTKNISQLWSNICWE